MKRDTHGLTPFAKQSHSIVAHENIFNTVPNDWFVEFLHVFCATIMFFWAFKDHVGLPYEIPDREERSSFHWGKAEFLVHFLKTYTILQLIDFLESMAHVMFN